MKLDFRVIIISKIRSFFLELIQEDLNFHNILSSVSYWIEMNLLNKFISKKVFLHTNI